MSDLVCNIKILDDIVKRTTDTIDEARTEIYDISENLRKECKQLEQEFAALKVEVKRLSDQIASTEKELKSAKSKLLNFNKNYNIYSEREAKDAYEIADKLRIDLIILKEKEKEAIKRRNETELRLKQSIKMLAKADNLVNQVGIAMSFLTGNLQDLSSQLQDIKSRQVFALEILKAQEEERYRVAREIHDGPAQTMANVIVKSELCDKLINIDINHAKSELKNLKLTVRDSLQDIRRIIYDLRPMSLDDLGLIPTIEKYAISFQENNNINVDFIFRGEFSTINSSLNLTVFRVMQEALSNIRKHSNAKNVKILLISENDLISLKIEDDGIGFDVEVKKTDDYEKGGFGLSSMRERVKLLNGKFSIKSSVGRGTRIVLSLPFIK